MLMDEKSMWNQRYSEGSHRSLEPDPLLVSAYEEFLSRRPAGSALDVAGGVGRHAIWLAARGWRVKLLDVSDVGIGLAKENAARALRASGKESLLAAETLDLNQMRGFDLGREQYYLVTVFFYLQRELFPVLAAALKPGGLLIYKTYTTEQQRISAENAQVVHSSQGGHSSQGDNSLQSVHKKTGPSHPMFLLNPNELLQAFSTLRVLHYHETIAEKGVAELVAVK